MESLERLRVVLVDPGEPGNVGAAARAMANMGLRRLVIVPRRKEAGYLLGAMARRMAPGAADVLEEAAIAADLPEALAGVSFAAATTARGRSRQSVLPLEDLPPLVLDRLDGGQDVALVFGPEDRGLTNQELDLCQCVVTIPADPRQTSLNLAQAVLLFAYEIGRRPRRGLAPEGAAPIAPAPAEEREAMYRQMEGVLLAIGYLNEGAPQHIMGDLRRLLDRADPTSREVVLLRGIWSQVAWAAERGEEGDGRE